MRALMFCAQFRPLVGGAERQAELLARELIRQGCEVEVLTVRRDPAHALQEDAEGLRIHRFPLVDLSKRGPRLGGLGIPNLLFQRVAIRRAVRELLPRFDLLHTHIASPLVAFAQEEARLLARPTLCKIACGGRGFDLLAVRRGSLLGTRIERKLVQRVDRWIAISDEIRQDLRTAGVPDDRVVSIPNGVAVPPPLPPRAPAPARRFLCLGRLMKFDFESLLGAFRALFEDVPEAELRIAGRGDVEPVRELVARTPGLASRVSVVGFSPSATELAWADALIHPSRAEGMSNILLEGMAAGLPCAASDIAPNREVLADGDTGLLFPSGDPGALLDVLRRLSGDAELVHRLATAGRKRVESHYAIDVVAAKYRALYEDCRRNG